MDLGVWGCRVWRGTLAREEHSGISWCGLPSGAQAQEWACSVGLAAFQARRGETALQNSTNWYERPILTGATPRNLSGCEAPVFSTFLL